MANSRNGRVFATATEAETLGCVDAPTAAVPAEAEMPNADTDKMSATAPTSRPIPNFESIIIP